MGLLEKYGRKKTGETRSKQIGAKIEKSLYKDFTAHCDNLGMSVSDGIRYLIIEELSDDKQSNNQGNTKVLPIDNKGVTKTQQTKKTAVNLTGWMINNKLPCPICGRWGHRKSFKKDHAAKHGYESSYDMIQANLDKVNQMVKEKRAESEQL